MMDAVAVQADMLAGERVNLNVGVLGHVDSGKTSLVRALSTELSTACLDRSPQSRERGITLDLGFSAFVTTPPPALSSCCSVLQVTLVDCPGHASLIRTIIGGAQIIDLVVLVVDASKGIQTQTAECIVIGEVTTACMIVVLNKVDLLPADDRADRINRLTRRIHKLLTGTRYTEVRVVSLSAAAGGVCGAADQEGVQALVQLIKSFARPRPGPAAGDGFSMAVDHCFAIKGHGTVLTGTLLSGVVLVGDTVELPALQQTRRVKSLQMFHRPVQRALRGDRVGLCVTGLDPKSVERGLVCSPGSVPSARAILCLVRRVRYFRPPVATGARLHVTIGHSTAVCTCDFFGAAELAAGAPQSSPSSPAADEELFPALEVDLDADFERQGELVGGEALQWALLQFPHPVLCGVGGLVVGSRLDADVRGKDADQCRIAFYGVARRLLEPGDLGRLRVYSWQEKQCTVSRLLDSRAGRCYELAAAGLYAKAGPSSLIGKTLRTFGGCVGVVVALYGTDGHKVRFSRGARGVEVGTSLTLRYKRYQRDSSGSMEQGEEPDHCPEEQPAEEPSEKEEAPAGATWDEPRRESAKARRRTKQSKSLLEVTTSDPPTPLPPNQVSREEQTQQAEDVPPAVCRERRRGVVESVKGGVAVVEGMFRIEEDIRLFVGRRCCVCAGGQTGALLGPFAKRGKCKVQFSAAGSEDDAPTVGVSIEMTDD